MAIKKNKSNSKKNRQRSLKPLKSEYPTRKSRRTIITLEKRAALGSISQGQSSPKRLTMRTLANTSPNKSPHKSITKNINTGATQQIDMAGAPIRHEATIAAIDAHAKEAKRVAMSTPNTTYLAVQFDQHNRPIRVLSKPDKVWNSHDRGETESQDKVAENGDHRGHGVSQASSNLPPGSHKSVMTSQSPIMNTAVQLTIERAVNTLLKSERIPYMEVHNEFQGMTLETNLPRPIRQSFLLASTDKKGKDHKLHAHFNVSQQ